MGPAEGTTAAAIEGTDSKGGVMDGDNHEALMGIFRSVAESETLGWRALRQIAANHVAGDVALAAAQRRSYGRDWSWRRLVAEHEAAHVLVRYLVTGTPAGAALLENGGGVAGGIGDTIEEAEELGTGGLSDGEKLEYIGAVAPTRTAALDRLPKAVERLLDKSWRHRAALNELAEELYGKGFVHENDAFEIIRGWLPNSPAHIRALAAAAEPAPAPGVEAGAGGGAGATTGDVRPDRAGGNGSAGGAKGACQVRAGGPDEAAAGLSGAMDTHPDRPKTLTNDERKHHV